METLIVKIGSRVLTQNDGHLNKEVVIGLVEDISKVKKENEINIALITSGAVSLGRSMIDLSEFKIDAEAIKYDKSIVKEQILAAVGQSGLMKFYTEEFEKYGIKCAQILATRSDFADREKYLSLRTVTKNLLKLGVVPIFNENDVLSPEELDFSDNDQLAAMIAAMLVADRLLILTNVDGVYDGSPSDPSSKIIPEIEEPLNFMKKVDASVQTGKGGMKSKLITADTITSLGISMTVANGLKRNIVRDIAADKKIGTFFPAKSKKVRALKNWLATAAISEGRIIVSTFLADILRKKIKTASILFNGIEKVEGNFSEKEVVEVCDDEGVILGKGLSKYGADKLREMVELYRNKPDKEKREKKSTDIIAIHFDYFVFS